MVENLIMNIRNPIYNAAGNIDCEIEHAELGWLAFTAAADDVELLGREVYAAALEIGPAAYVPPSDAVALAAARAAASMTRMEFFTALESIDLFDTVWAMQDDENVAKLTRIMLRTASKFDRTHPDLVAMAASMGITDAQIDALYGIEG